jgi:hypothetical protein
MDYWYPNEFIDLGIGKAMRHHKFDNEDSDWYILLRRILSGLC